MRGSTAFELHFVIESYHPILQHQETKSILIRQLLIIPYTHSSEKEIKRSAFNDKRKSTDEHSIYIMKLTKLLTTKQDHIEQLIQYYSTMLCWIHHQRKRYNIYEQNAQTYSKLEISPGIGNISSDQLKSTTQTSVRSISHKLSACYDLENEIIINISKKMIFINRINKIISQPR